MRTAAKTDELERRRAGEESSGHGGAEEELRQRYGESEAVRQIISATAAELELPAVLDKALRGTLKLTGLEGGTLCLVNPEQESLELAASVNTSPEVIADLTTHRIRIGDCLCGHCARDCQPLVLWDNASGSAFATREAARKEGIRFHAAFPLRGRERCIGVLCLFARSEKKPSERSLALTQDVCGPIALAIENTLLYQGAKQQIGERARAEEGLRRTNRTLRMLSRCNQVLVRAAEEARLLGDICRIVVEEGGYRMAWVGFSQADEARSVLPAAQAGFEQGYLETLGIVWSDTERGRGPAGTAIRTGQPYVVQNILTELRFAPWRAEALKRGYASAVGCPLLESGRAFGVLTIYAEAPNAFDAAEVTLLAELADNLAFGLMALRTRAGQKQAEAALQELGQKNEEALRVARMGHWEFDVQSGCFTFNDQYYRLHGTTAAQAGGYQMKVEEFVRKYMHPRDAHLVQESIRKAVASDNPEFEFQTEARILRADGEMRTVVCWFRTEKDAGGATVKLHGVNQDITERKRAEEALGRSEQRYRSLFEHMMDGFAVCRVIYEKGEPRDYIYLNVNGAFEKLTGLKDVVGKPVSEVIPGIHQSNPELLELLGRVSLSGEPARVEVWIEPLASWFLLSVYSLEREHFAVIFANITERKRAEEALRESEERLAMAHKAANAGTWDWDVRSGRLVWSEELFGLFGLEVCAEPSFELWRSALHPEDRAEAEARLEAAIRERTQLESEYRVVHRGGRTRWISALGRASYDREGRPRRMTGICLDVTERKAFQGELQRLVAERTAQLAEANENLKNFAHTAAHDLRSPLRGISSFAAITLQQYGERLDPMGRSMLERVVGSATEMGRLLSDLLEYSQITQTELRLERVPLEEVVQEALRLLEEDIRAKGAELSVEGPLPQVVAHRATVAMVVCNLVSNGLKFVVTGVRPQLRVWATERVERRSGGAAGPEDAAPTEHARYVRLWVEDNGIGIAAEDQGKVFGAFQRLHAKGTYPGTGLGLAIVRKGVERMGGRVGVESEVGRGSRFWVELRRAEGEEGVAG